MYYFRRQLIKKINLKNLKKTMKTTKKLLPVVIFPIAAICVGMAFFSSCSKENITPTSAASTTLSSSGEDDATTGNGSLSGTHYELNIIGVPKGKTATMTSGNRIFVPLVGTCKIMLNEGATFNVLDGNGTDGVASFQLPNPDPTNTGTTTYSVYARATAGKGSSTMTTCATDPTTGAVVCSTESLVSVKSTKFANVSQDLLYIYADLTGSGTVTRYPLFDAALQDYFWNYDNNGLKNLQLRFYYNTPTTVK